MIGRSGAIARMTACLALAFCAVAAMPRGAHGQDARDGIRLSWAIKSHAQVYGFNVYRAESRAGPFVRVNRDLVRDGEDLADAGQRRFTWIDTSATAGRTYYYYVDVVSGSGISSRLTQVLSRTAGAPP